MHDHAAGSLCSTGACARACESPHVEVAKYLQMPQDESSSVYLSLLKGSDNLLTKTPPVQSANFAEHDEEGVQKAIQYF